LDHRLARFSEMNTMLNLAERRIRLCEHRNAFFAMVADCEDQLLSEVGEWYRRTRHIHIR